MRNTDWGSLDGRDDLASAGRSGGKVPDSARAQGFDGEAIDLVLLTTGLLKYRRLIGIVTGAVMIVTAGWMLLTPNTYRSVASILPSGGIDKFASIKSLAGLGGTSGGDENSSALFPVVLRSNRLIDELLTHTYRRRDGNNLVNVDLSDYFGTDSPERLRNKLRKATTISVDKATGLISLAVETEYPEMSREIARQYLDELDSFNRHKRASQAREQEAYLRTQLAEAETMLQAVEDSLAAFQAANRNWSSSTDPELLKELGQLQHEAEVRYQSYLFLTKQYEIARLDVQKDLPIVRVLDHPALPEQKSGPHRTLTTLVAGTITFLTLVFVLLFIEAVKMTYRNRRMPELESLREEIRKGMPRPLRLVLRAKQAVSKQHT